MRSATRIVGLLLLCFYADTISIAGTEKTLTVQEAVTTALTHHPTVRIGATAVEAAQARVRQQIAGYLPRGAYTYVLTRQQRSLTQAVGGIQAGEGQQRTISQVFNFHSTNFSMSQLLFDFGRTLDAIRAASASVNANIADLETTRQTVIINTKQAYYGLLSSQQLLGVAEETLRQNQKHLEDAQARFEVGIAPRFDVTQAQVQVSTAELDLVTARNNVALGQETLRTTMGVTDFTDFVLVDAPEHQPVAINDAEILQQAYRQRSELQSVQAQQQAATQRVSSLQKGLLPSLTGDAQYNWTGRKPPLQDGWILGVTLTVPLFDSILTVAQVSEAQATLQSLEAQEEDLRLQVALDVRRSMLELRRAEQSIRVSEQTVISARENLDLAEGRYTAGVGNIIEVTDAQVSFSSARANSIQAIYSYKTALAQLERALGKGLD
jgi:outer membrane protein TolC